jgi:uncharacterized paraquat-inducible protein A
MTEILEKSPVVSPSSILMVHCSVPADSLYDLDQVRKAPQRCSKCGAAFRAPLLRGQTETQCEYCGLVTRI